MKFVLLVLALAAISFAKIAKVEYTVPSLGYSFKGEIQFTGEYPEDLIMEGDGVHQATYTGITTVTGGKTFATDGTIEIDDPVLLNLDKVRVTGKMHMNPQITYTGIMVVKLTDIIKPQVPFKGHLKYSNNKEADILGSVERPI